MNNWFSPSQLAELPTMPNSKRLVNILISNDGDWASRPRVGRGGGKEYQIPDRYQTPELIKALAEKFGDRLEVSTIVDDGILTDEDSNLQALIAEGEAAEDPDAYLSAIQQLEKDGYTPDQVRAFVPEKVDFELPLSACEISEESDDDLRLNARYEILKRWAKSVEGCVAAGGSKLGCDTIFVEKVKDGSIAIPDWVRKGISSNKGKIKLSRALLFQWKDLANAGSAALRPKFKGKDGQSFFDLRPDYALVAEALAREFGATATVLHYAFTSGVVKEDFGLEEVPTESQIQGWLTKRNALNHQRSRAFATGDKSVILSAQGSYSRGLKPNDKWEIDSTKADATAKKENIVWLQSRFGEAPVRCALVAAIDVATRQVKILVRPTSNGEAIANLIADCIRDWGLPKVVKTDNGNDYIGKHVGGFCRAMGIEQKLCVVKQPWQKPHIERFMRSLQHSPAWEMLPWNTGHNVAQQQAYRKRRDGELVLGWTIEAFQSWIDRWVDAYHNSLHEGLGCSPMERLASFRTEGFVALMPKNLEKNLEFALLLEDLCTVNKGGLKYQGRFYIAPELVSEVGKQVAVRFNPENPNQIYVYSGQDLTTAKLICIATWDMALTPEEQAAIASTKPVISEAIRKYEEEIKKARRNLKSAIAKNPEKLLPSRGGVAALRATEQIDTASSNLIAEIESAVSKKPENTDAPEMQAKRQEWLEMQARKAAEQEPVEEVRTGHDWRRIWEMSDRPIHETEWLLQTIDIGGYGGYVAMIERKSLDEMRETLDQELRDRVA